MKNWGETIGLEEQIDSWQEELVAWESQIARIRARQVELIRRLDRFQVDTAQGARTMGDWAAATLMCPTKPLPASPNSPTTPTPRSKPQWQRDASGWTGRRH